MTGYPEFNYPTFFKEAERIRNLGHKVINPAEHFNGETHHPRPVYMRENVVGLLKANALVVLEGWQDSKGAVLEVMIAEELDIPILGTNLQPTKKETVLEEAQRLVMGPRQGAYGHPLDDFTRTGRIWGAVLPDPVCPNCGHQFDHLDVPAETVGLCLIGVKMSRECNHPKRDNRTDGCGYWATIELLHTEKACRSIRHQMKTPLPR